MHPTIRVKQRGSKVKIKYFLGYTDTDVIAGAR
uniref:Uncharacterized protein n=1 Tax=Arundo donax TaxID=35708 RepID=A0A0A9HC34_ARUDO